MKFWFAVFVVFFFTPFLAFAQSGPAAQIVVPWGMWLGQELQFWTPIAWPLLAAAVLWLANKIGGPYAKIAATVLQSREVQDAARRSIDAGVGAITGVTRNETWTLPQSSAVFAAMVRYAFEHEPVFAGWAEQQVKGALFPALMALPAVPSDAGANSMNMPALVTSKP